MRRNFSAAQSPRQLQQPCGSNEALCKQVQSIIDFKLQKLAKTAFDIMKAAHLIRSHATTTSKGDVSRSFVDGELLHRDMKAFAMEISKDPEAALGFLKRAGIVTRTGKIAKAYGG